ncbi:MAG: NAD(P)/FAD-dependent oxidoreductase [Hyphomonadaceae bacterium]|nr:NAD(P)/FAD-dependent oxidoreductase [Hyphomonadaceae bacterium]
MSVTELQTDYLIVGAGAVGMAFADTLLHETDANIIIVDMFQKPGGHWNNAYPFVTLHQPSQFYGVSSKELSKGRKDEVGLNRGLNELASGAEVMAYFDQVMKHTFLPSGRVQYFPMCEYTEDGNFYSLLTGDKYHVTRTKTVDATYLNTTIPLTHTPNFSVAEGMNFIPLNDLPKIQSAPEGYVVIGGGKTGIDACLWLLENQVAPNKIRWIVSRDAWLLNRKNTQPTPEFFEHTIGAQANQFESIAKASSIEDMFDRLEACGYFVRLDPDVRPTMFHGATISEMEVEELRRIKNIVRLGRVTAIEHDKIILDQGEISTGPGVVHVDCSATAITNDVIVPVFQGDLIVPQTVRSYQPVFSAAFIAHIEAGYDQDDEVNKNNICGVVPLPNHDTDYIRFTAGFMMNQYNWSRNPDIREWLLGNRLDGFSKMVAEIDKDDVEKKAILKKLRDNSMPAMAKLQQFMAEIS